MKIYPYEFDDTRVIDCDPLNDAELLQVLNMLRLREMERIMRHKLIGAN